MTGPYIGPERRKGAHPDRRTFSEEYSRACRVIDELPERRTTERRQEALAGVIVGLTAEDMTTLAAFWQGYEAERRERARA